MTGIQASKLRKGCLVLAPCSTHPEGARWVRLTRREKWSPTRTKLHVEDCGEGLPTAQFGIEHLPMTWVFANSTDVFQTKQP